MSFTSKRNKITFQPNVDKKQPVVKQSPPEVKKQERVEAIQKDVIKDSFFKRVSKDEIRELNDQVENMKLQSARLKNEIIDLKKQVDIRKKKEEKMYNKLYPYWEMLYYHETALARSVANRFGVNPEDAENRLNINDFEKLFFAFLDVSYFNVDMKMYWDFKDLKSENENLKIESADFKKKVTILEQEKKQSHEEYAVKLKEKDAEIKQLKTELSKKPKVIEVPVIVEKPAIASVEEPVIVQEEEMVVEPEVEPIISQLEPEIETEVNDEIYEEETNFDEVEFVEEVTFEAEELEDISEEFSSKTEVFEEQSETNDDGMSEANKIVDEPPFVLLLKSEGYNTFKSKNPRHDILIEYEKDRKVPLCYFKGPIENEDVLENIMGDEDNGMIFFFKDKQDCIQSNSIFTKWNIVKKKRKYKKYSFTTVEDLKKNHVVNKID
jgi:hypothetical protein